jgi:UrcA family protein
MAVQETIIRMSVASGVTLALLVGVASAALAKPVTVIADRLHEDQLSERVSYADLNLASAEGVKTLTWRVSGAVRRVCAPLEHSLKPIQHSQCTSFALKGAQPQMERAIVRAQEIAANGTSSIAPVAIVIATRH